MMCVGYYEIKPPTYKKFTKKNKCTYTNDKLESGLVYLYLAFQFNVINASTTYTKYRPTLLIHSLSLPMTKLLNHFSSIACNTTIESNKQKTIAQ